MKTALKDYSEAFELYSKLSKDETSIRLAKKQAYYRFMQCKEELRALERQIMSEDKVLPVFDDINLCNQ